jgi:hypothetical protein
VDKFAERFTTLEKATYHAAKTHFRAIRACSELKTIAKAIDKHYGNEIVLPSRPTAEEVYQLIARWTEWTKQLFALERSARLAVIAFKNAILPRKIALRELHNAIEHVPSAKSLTDFGQIALIVLSESVHEAILDATDDTEFPKVDSVPQRDPASASTEHPEKEQELTASLRQVTEVFGYALAAKRMAGSQYHKKLGTLKPQPPAITDGDAGEDWLQKAIDLYQVSLDRREEDIDRASRMLTARATQLEACRFQMDSARARCQKRSEGATDDLLIPMEVARQLSDMLNMDRNDISVNPRKRQ